MTRWVKGAFAAITLALGAGGAGAGTFTQVGTSVAGGTATVIADFTDPNMDGFDFYLQYDLGNATPFLALAFAGDDPSDGGLALYTPFAFAPSGAVTGTGSATVGGIDYTSGGSLIGAFYNSGFRVNNLTPEVGKFALDFVIAPYVLPGTLTVAYFFESFTNVAGTIDTSSDLGIFEITVIDQNTVVPLPAGGVLILTGLGALAVNRRARRAA